MADRLAPPVPREHGAWAVLYGPFLIAVAVTLKFNLDTLVLLVTISALFLAHEPFAKLVRVSKHGVRADLQRHWQKWLAIYLLSAAIGVAYLLAFRAMWFLVPFGAGSALLLAVHLWLTSKRQERFLPGELIGVVGLTATGPVACAVNQGGVDGTVFMIWLLNILYFASGIFYVKMRVSRFLKKHEFVARLTHSAIYHTLVVLVLVLLSQMGLIPAVLALAYAPMLGRAAWYMFWPEKKLNIRRIGYTEVGFTLLFIFAITALWHLQGV